MSSTLRGLAAATGLLTRVPVRAGSDPGPATLGLWFPVVGALTGALVAGVLLATGRVLPAAAAALLTVACEVVLTGALHLDGLADTADSAGGHDPAGRLAIMRDHSIGVYGSAALVLSLALRASCLAALLAAPLPWPSVVALLVAGWTISRTAMLVPAGALDYPRSHGTARSFVTTLTAPVAGVGTALGVIVVLAAALLGSAAGWRPFVVGVCAASVTTALLTRWAATRIGGVTGDVLGAVAETALAAALVAEVAGLPDGPG